MDEKCSRCSRPASEWPAGPWTNYHGLDFCSKHCRDADCHLRVARLRAVVQADPRGHTAERATCLLYYDDATGNWNRVREEHLGNLPERIGAMVSGEFLQEPAKAGPGWRNRPASDAPVIAWDGPLDFRSIPDERREARRMLSAKMMEVGDQLWAEIRQLKGWEG